MANNNQTFVPGMEQSTPAGTYNPYARPEVNGQGTFVPGMSAPVQSPESTPITEGPTVSVTPVVGFLYSISRNGITEYWPIHLGANIIGRNANCDARLNEGSVSERHAQLNVKQMRTSKRLIATIQDIGSKNGMFLNEEELDYDAHPCKNGDVVTIGNAYKLLIILVDTESYGLCPSNNFIAIEAPEEPAEKVNIPTFGPTPSNMRDAGTVDLSGANNSYAAPGGTMIIE